jgi:hypothetical protein
MTTISLRAVTTENLYAIVKLEVAEAQKQFVAPNVYSMAEAALEPKAWPRAIYADETPVGFFDDAKGLVCCYFLPVAFYDCEGASGEGIWLPGVAVVA